MNCEFTKFLVKNNIIPSMGHSNATFQESMAICKKGASHVTHLFNGMSGVDQHHPGLAVAGLYCSKLICELISDGHHVKPSMVKLIYKNKGRHKLCLITDSMLAKGLPDGPYMLGELKVIKTGDTVNRITTDPRSLAGSVVAYDTCFRNFRKFTGAGYCDMIYLTSINAAKQLNIFDKTGSIEVGKFADLTVLDNHDQVVYTIVEGKIVFQRGKN